MARVAVAGTTSWGTTLAVLFASTGNEVALLARAQAEADELNAKRENVRRCPGLRLPEGLTCTIDLEAVATAEIFVLAVPSASLSDNLARLAPAIPPEATVLTAVKGLEIETADLPSDVIVRFGIDPAQVVALSGPNFAREIATGLPAATVVAGADFERPGLVQRALNGPAFRVYTSEDRIGVQLGGALKNVIAIACGISDGLGFGDNAKAALLTRSLAEITRLGRAAGARPQTFAGLAGLGDLVLSCHSDLSRNRRLGLALGRGAALAEALASIDGVVEGAVTARAIPVLRGRYGVELPICEALHDVLYAGKTPLEAVGELMSRSARAEPEDIAAGG